jgi:serine/threonine protein phosphatase PrpC
MFEIDASVLTHMGKVRTNNEDSVTFVRPNAAEARKSHGVLAVVADGMGGHEAGELASKLAAEGIARGYYRSCATPPEALADAFREANREIFETSAKDPGLKGMGTTCVAAAILDDLAWWAWVGDSRLYLLRRGRIYRMSEDHTVVHEMVRRGLLTAEEAHCHPERSALARAMGTRESIELAVGAQPIHLADGDRLLLCSDGLHDLLTDEEIAEYAGETLVAASAERLLLLALERGGFDNISIVLLEAKLESEVVKKPASITREHVCE